MRADILLEVARVFEGSSGNATQALYAQLEQLGGAGVIAAYLFRACKNSSRAKVYRRGTYRGVAYNRKEWAMEKLEQLLVEHAEACGIRWGWGEDSKQQFHRAVLYVDLPTGQVSFHTRDRGAGPAYPGEWDGVVDASAGRICTWAARLLSQENPHEDDRHQACR